MQTFADFLRRRPRAREWKGRVIVWIYWSLLHARECLHKLRNYYTTAPEFPEFPKSLTRASIVKRNTVHPLKAF
jgi:hypothetical protein